MTILITGAAGFIGSHVAAELLARGERIVGLDNMNSYYDPDLKRARLARLHDKGDFHFIPLDLGTDGGLVRALGEHKFKSIVHLGAQAGVRYSIDNPDAYVRSNLVGHMNILELARHTDGIEHLVYASSSSVYGGNTKLPFSENDAVETPVSLYAATKRSNEILSQSYSHLYGIPQTGLRFFTVYGPWGRPDMAYWLFTEAILKGEKIRIFNNGDMGRDFTYIDDIVDGILRVLDHPPAASDSKPLFGGGKAPHRVYNIGNNEPERLMDMISILEAELGREAVKEFAPMQPGDVKETYAEISAISGDLGFKPTTPLSVGLKKFVAWYKDYYDV
ncbi:NAD-dependent epimerase/dehydratase family protein [Gimibacter soli]|uniref:NAD-dependent epimerase/dehydratase family protein n=1 Tax=Gimibacter soli TaxID=3024400 RepID=A0AAF0BL57_9PROT|nr:NAD-dependent epimerase/dehydratase family protein [Gimibacter soli]WCL53747.1 NAD-dependent epimerase/dehydratase family protein [Gimibacter soli]